MGDVAVVGIHIAPCRGAPCRVIRGSKAPFALVVSQYGGSILREGGAARRNIAFVLRCGPMRLVNVAHSDRKGPAAGLEMRVKDGARTCRGFCSCEGHSRLGR